MPTARPGGCLLRAVHGLGSREENLVVFGRWGWNLVVDNTNGHFAAEQCFGFFTPINRAVRLARKVVRFLFRGIFFLCGSRRQ